MRGTGVIVASALLIASCSGAASEPEEAVPVAAETPKPEPGPEPEPEPAPEPTGDQIEACVIAWQAEQRAVDAGVMDDSTLRATAFECPDYATWVRVRDQINYRGSPNLIRALCAVLPESPVCSDPRRPQG